MGHIFVSYSRKDSKEIDFLVKEIEAAGYRVWIDRGSIRGGEQWDENIANAIAGCEAFLVALSPSSAVSEHVKDELNFAREEGRRVIPVVISPLEIPPALRFRLATIQRINLTDSRGTEVLIDALGGRKESRPLSKQNDFFISYNKDDQKWAEWIAWQLEGHGYSVIIQMWDSLQGSNFITWMHEASRNSERTLAVLSSSYFAGKFSQMEWTSALYNNKLLPVRVQDVEMTGLMGAVAYIDLVGLNEEEALERLLNGIKTERRKPIQQPAFADQASHSIQPTRFPGSLPPIWNVPFNRNNNFTGREAVLNSLYESLHSNQGSLHIHAVSGLGGIGKTQVALEYAYRYSASYNLVWWIHSEEPTNLTSSYLLLAKKLSLPQRNTQEQGTVVQAVREHLQNTKDWLLIFDNAETLESIEPYLPVSTTRGHVIITSRNPNWGRVARPLSLLAWSREESISFLESRTGRSDNNGAENLAEALGDLPLALEQAAAYMMGTEISYVNYLKLYKRSREKIWMNESPVGDYPDKIANTFNATLQQCRGSRLFPR